MGPCHFCGDWRRLIEVKAPPDFKPAGACQDCCDNERADGTPLIHHSTGELGREAPNEDLSDRIGSG